MEKTQMHFYESSLPLFETGLGLGVILLALSAHLLIRRESSKVLLAKLARDAFAGQILLAVGMFWFWLLVAPAKFGLLGKLAVNLGEFAGIQRPLLLAIPVCYVLMCTYVKEFLFVRALGLFFLMLSGPILAAAYLEAPITRLLLPVLAYVLIFVGMYFVGKPYLYRDAVSWVSAKNSRWSAVFGGLVAYSVAIIACALLFWR